MIDFDAIDVTNITKLLALSQEDYDAIHSGGEIPEYDEYTLYLVNNGTDIESEDSEGQELRKSYSDLYYGVRKVTDLLISRNYPDNNEYPNDKMYLVPRYSDEVWPVAGQEVSPVGFNIYFKHNDILTPISTSLIAGAHYDNISGAVVIDWNTDDGVVPTPIITSEVVVYLLEHLSETEGLTTSLINQLYNDSAEGPGIKAKIENDIFSGGVIEQLTEQIEDEEDARIAADQDLQDAIDQEISDRESADQGLQDAIDQEISDRTDAIQTVQGQISQEVSARLTWHPVVD